MPTTNNVIAMPEANPATNSPADKPLSIVPDVGDSFFMHDSSITTYHKRPDGLCECMHVCMHVCIMFLCLCYHNNMNTSMEMTKHIFAQDVVDTSFAHGSEMSTY